MTEIKGIAPGFLIRMGDPFSSGAHVLRSERSTPRSPRVPLPFLLISLLLIFRSSSEVGNSIAGHCPICFFPHRNVASPKSSPFFLISPVDHYDKGREDLIARHSCFSFRGSPVELVPGLQNLTILCRPPFPVLDVAVAAHYLRRLQIERSFPSYC